MTHTEVTPRQGPPKARAPAHRPAPLSRAGLLMVQRLRSDSDSVRLGAWGLGGTDPRSAPAPSPRRSAPTGTSWGGGRRQGSVGLHGFAPCAHPSTPSLHVCMCTRVQLPCAQPLVYPPIYTGVCVTRVCAHITHYLYLCIHSPTHTCVPMYRCVTCMHPSIHRCAHHPSVRSRSPHDFPHSLSVGVYEALCLWVGDHTEAQIGRPDRSVTGA